MDANKEIIQYRGPLLPKYYNQFFHPNICHICKSRSKYDNLILCNQCRIISYCSRSHEIIHKSQHKEMCDIITKFPKLQIQLSDLKERNKIIITTKQKLDRDLEPYEMQMFMYIKSCLCCKTTQTLRSCTKCFSAYYCQRHVQDFYEKHKLICKELKLSLDISIATITDRPARILRDFIACLNKDLLCFDTFQLLSAFVLARQSIDWTVDDYVISDYISEPLTFYYAIKKTNCSYILQNKCIIIHIIAADSIDRSSLSAWEILLHCLPDLRKLIIVMIGLQLKDELFNTHELCESCKREKKELGFTVISAPYYDYLFSRYCKLPDVVVGFQVKFEEKIWSKTIRALQTRQYPLLLTSSSKSNAFSQELNIRTVLNEYLLPQLEIKNIFCGYAPHRSILATDYNNIYYRNKYIIFYKNLCSIIK
ncbi:uncharacterized protein LOC116846788 [Odontomachus brunneus]|uniref:uncharacterized protein LOC116846788 n=1 Tax=Odontomachus brunneus TaxID=486640 RepID=UPI0013F1CD2B|nr:uncharacterized protein LOC116846788 [Odontomachus brunneus]